MERLSPEKILYEDDDYYYEADRVRGELRIIAAVAEFWLSAKAEYTINNRVDFLLLGIAIYILLLLKTECTGCKYIVFTTTDAAFKQLNNPNEPD